MEQAIIIDTLTTDSGHTIATLRRRQYRRRVASRQWRQGVLRRR